MNVIIVGNGMMGKERTRALKELGITPYAVLDKDDVLTDVQLDQADWVFVCTPPMISVQIIERIRNSHPKMKILVEKPYLGDYMDVFVGYNYRFYRGIKCLLGDIDRGEFGRIVSVNMTLAMGDAPGTDKGWRLEPKMIGGGVMHDLGVHLIDLALLMSYNNLELKSDISWEGFWRKGASEEQHIIARDYAWSNKIDRHDRNTIYNIQVSKVRWHSEFKIEVNGEDGYGIVEGRNRHYGRQTYRRGKRWAWRDSGKSQKETEVLVVDYDGEDSFTEELMNLFYNVKPKMVATAQNNKRVLDFISNL
jgi:hypothetical protein